jgi:hypothetical protein
MAGIGEYLGRLASGRFGWRLARVLHRYAPLPLEVELRLNLAERPSYLYCAYHAAELARRLGLRRISAIEFGVAGGNGVIFLEQAARKIEQTLGVTIEVYGFDTGGGLPNVTLAEDLPYWFRPQQYKMDVAALQTRLHSAKLVLGNVAETVRDFFSKYQPAPVGAIFNDLDLYTSTCDSLKLFDADVRHFAPRVFMYFDDVIGTEFEMYSECNGQLLALSEFNRRQCEVYIGLNQNLVARPDITYARQIYYAHIKKHPLYSEYIGGDDQVWMEGALRLKQTA